MIRINVLHFSQGINFLRYIFHFCGLTDEGGEGLDKAIADKALDTAYRQYGQAIEKYCRVSLGEAGESAADCTQEAFYVYYKKLLEGESFDNPRAFLYKTAHNFVLKTKEKYFKEARRTKTLDEAEKLSAELYNFISDETDYDRIKELLISELREEEQRLYEWRFTERKPLQEIAEQLGTNPAAAANRIARLRKKIIGLIQKGGQLKDDYR